MAADNLTAPLGVDKATGKRRRVRIPFGLIGIGLLSVVAAVIIVWLSLFDDPLGGEPLAVVDIEQTATGVTQTSVEVVEIRPPETTSKASDAESGEDASAIAAVEPPPATAGDAPRRGPLSTTPVPKITENSRNGPLPRTASDGSRPLDLYAAPVSTNLKNVPQIAIVIGGLGLSQTGTQEAIRKLPKEVTLAFAPYGGSLDRWMRRARGNGHEILLQLPLEPFDFPDNDPGPHTLLTTLSVEENIGRLHWVLGRLTNYVGVVNYMGARFTSSADALAPMLEELGRRGLLYFDDGASSRSIAQSVAHAARAPFLRGEVLIDATATAGDIDTRLLELESIARSDGSAVGVASALPITVARIAEWAKTLESRGAVLVPVTAVLRKRQQR